MAPSPYDYTVAQPSVGSYFDAMRQGRTDRLAVEQEQRNNALSRYLPGALQGDDGQRQSAMAAAQGDPNMVMQLSQSFSGADRVKLEKAREVNNQIASLAAWADSPDKWPVALAEARKLSPDIGDIPFEQRGAIIAKALTVADQLEQAWKAKAHDLDVSRTTAQNTASYASAAASRASAGRGMGGVRAPSGYQYVVGEDGQPSLQVIPGGPADPAMKPLTDEQAKAAGFAARLRDADNRLWRPGVSTALKSGYNTTVAEVPLISNALVTDEYQVGDQARRDFLNAQLRRESGAVIGESEFDSGQKQYFPEYEDKEDVLLNKAASRKQAIYNMYVSAGPRYAEEARKAKTDYEKTIAFIEKKLRAKEKAAGVGGNYRQEQRDLLSGKTPGAVAPPPGFKIVP